MADLANKGINSPSAHDSEGVAKGDVGEGSPSAPRRNQNPALSGWGGEGQLKEKRAD